MLIHWSSLGGHENITNYLLENKSPVDLADDTGLTPLILAASAGRVPIVRTLIGAGADVNHKSQQGHSALQYACSKGWMEVSKNLSWVKHPF